MKITENVPLSQLTTMRLGGPARFVIDIETKDDIPEAYKFAKSRDLPTFILGSGANTIARDEGFPGVILRNRISGIHEQPNSVDSRPYATNEERNERSEPRNDGSERARRESTELGCYAITIEGGTDWDAVVAFACERGLTGIEAMSKIPGLTGAAPVQNIGAYGQDISQTFVSAEVYDTTTGSTTTLNKDAMDFSYRKSILNTTEKGRYFVISVTLQLKSGRMERPFYNSIEKYIFDHNETVFTPQNIRKIVSAIRADKLPDPAIKASAGSFFKNIYLTEDQAFLATQRGIPLHRGNDGIKINAGWLIEQCGLAGQLIDGIRISPTAALVLINESATSYNQLASARAHIIDAVFNKFGFRLEQEPMELYP